MRLLRAVYVGIGYLCATLAALCVGYAIASGESHVIFTAILYGIVSFMCLASDKQDKKDEQKLLRHE